MMKNNLHKKVWSIGAIQIHAEMPLILLINSSNDKFCRDPTSENSDLYILKTVLFDKRDL